MRNSQLLSTILKPRFDSNAATWHTITTNGIVYDVVDVDVDAQGGVVLKLRVT